MNTKDPLIPNTSLHPAAAARRLIHVGLATIALAFGGVGTWAAFAPLSGAVIGEGTVKVDNNRKTVQHLEGGIVKEILVRDGDKVQAGQKLVVLSDERNSAQLAIIQEQYDAELARGARLRAERNGQTHVVFPAALTASATVPRVAELLRNEAQLFETRRRNLEEQVGFLSEQMLGARQELEGLEVRRIAEKSGRQSQVEELLASEKLEAQGFISKVQVLRLRRATEDYASRLATTLSETAKTRQKLADLQSRASALRSELRKVAADEYAMSQTKLAQIQQQLKPSADLVTRQTIVAPISGTVVNLMLHTVGGVIGPRDPVLDIVPANVPLIVETKIRLDDVRHVHEGMSADLRLTAYPSLDAPILKGKVSYLSADKTVERMNGQEYFIAHVTLDPSSVKAAPNVTLVSGMHAEVFLKTGERTAMDYVLAPINASLRRAARQE